MLQRGLIRASVVHAKTVYFKEIGKPRGTESAKLGTSDYNPHRRENCAVPRPFPAQPVESGPASRTPIRRV